MTQLGMKPHNSTNAYNFETRTDRFHVYPCSVQLRAKELITNDIKHARPFCSIFIEMPHCVEGSQGQGQGHI